MKLKPTAAWILLMLLSCNTKLEQHDAAIDLTGTWQLISGTVIQKEDTTFTDYTKNNRMIKVINQTHFAFLSQDLTKGKDSTATFAAGGGRYELKGDQYTEHLEYCNDRSWVGHHFHFTIKIQDDTLTQSGMEKIEGTGVNRMNIEKYVRMNIR